MEADLDKVQEKCLDPTGTFYGQAFILLLLRPSATSGHTLDHHSPDGGGANVRRKSSARMTTSHSL